MKKCLVSLFMMLSLIIGVSAQVHDSTQPHSDEVSALISVPSKVAAGSEFYSASKDGFVIKWKADKIGEHYQLTDIGIKQIAASPDGRYVAISETDGGSLNRVSVWEWKTLTKVFTKKYSDTVNAIKFSAQGTYLIIGTATVDAVEFFRTKDWIKVPNVLDSNANVVSYIYTSDSEKTALFYAPSGNFSYYNLQNGQLKLKLSLTSGLKQTVLYNNSMMFAGVKDNKIYIYNATNGKLIKDISAVSPIIISNEKDLDLTYFENDGRGGYTLRVIKTEEKNVLPPVIAKTFKGPKGTSALSAGLRIDDMLYFGSKDGSIYSISTEESLTSPEVEEFSQPTFKEICDISKNNDYFYLLTPDALYLSNYKDGGPNKVFDTSGQTNLITYNEESVILYSKGVKAPINLFNTTDGQKTLLFTPKNPVQQLKLFKYEDNTYLVEIENSTSVFIYDFAKKSYKEVYSGAGIQDAVITSDKMLYVAKSAATNPRSPLICVDLATHETVSAPVAGNVAFSLSTDGENVYGVEIQPEDNVQTTYVFSYNTKTKTAYNMLKFEEEDSRAFTYFENGIIYSNIGKAQVYCYNLKSKNRYNLNRSASLPVQIVQNDKQILLLNKNGSVTWIDAGTNKVIADWYYSNKGWIEF